MPLSAQPCAGLVRPGEGQPPVDGAVCVCVCERETVWAAGGEGGDAVSDAAAHRAEVCVLCSGV